MQIWAVFHEPTYVANAVAQGIQPVVDGLMSAVASHVALLDMFGVDAAELSLQFLDQGSHFDILGMRSAKRLRQ